MPRRRLKYDRAGVLELYNAMVWIIDNIDCITLDDLLLSVVRFKTKVQSIRNTMIDRYNVKVSDRVVLREKFGFSTEVSLSVDEFRDNVVHGMLHYTDDSTGDEIILKDKVLEYANDLLYKLGEVI